MKAATLAACMMAVAILSALPARAATATIGELTLDYDARRWTVEPAGDGATIACHNAECSDIRIALTTQPDDPAPCTIRRAYEAAVEAFPFAERHAINPHTVGNLYLVFAESRTGPLLDAPGAVSGCISRGGTYYGFRSLFDGPPPSNAAAPVLALLSGLSGPPAHLRTATVGGLTFDFRDDVWQAVPGASPEHTTLECLPPTCAESRPTVEIAANRDPASCAADLLPPNHGDLDKESAIRSRGGISFVFQGVWRGCRNRVPPRLLACAVHQDIAYSVGTTDTGCRSSMRVPVDAFNELIASMRPNNP